MEIDTGKFNLYSAENTGFTPINDEYPQTVFQCVMCFGLVLAGVPNFIDVPNLHVPDPFQHHRNNCFGWQKV